MPTPSSATTCGASRPRRCRSRRCHRDEILAEADSADAVDGLHTVLPARGRCGRARHRGLLRSHEFDKVEIYALAIARAGAGAAHRDGGEGRGDHRGYSASRGARSRSAAVISARPTTAASTSRSTRPVSARGWRCRRSVGSATTRPAGPTSASVAIPSTASRPRAPRSSTRSTARPSPCQRVLAAIIENMRQADGSIVIPEALHPYTRGHTVIPVP